MIQMNDTQKQIFASSMVAYIVAEKAEDEISLDTEETLLVQFDPKELIILSLGLMLADCFIPTRMLCGENTTNLMSKIADLIEVQFPEVLEND